MKKVLQYFLFFKFQISFLLFFVFSLNAQETWKLYDDSEVAIISVTVNPEHLDWIYQNPERDSLFPSTVHFKNAIIKETIDSVGFRIRGNTSTGALQKNV